MCFLKIMGTAALWIVGLAIAFWLIHGAVEVYQDVLPALHLRDR